MQDRIKVVIVDDEPQSIHRLQDDLATLEDFEVIATSSSAVSAKNLVMSIQPDVLFIDVEMPGQTGFEVLQSLRDEIPMDLIVVFYSAFDKYMIEGAVKYYDKVHRNFISQRLQHLKTRLSRHFNIDEQHIGLYAHHQILCRYRRRGCGNHLKIFQSCQIILQPVDALWFIVHNHNLNSILHVISF